MPGRLRGDAQTPMDSVSGALALLHVRACQTSREVHALLATGFPGRCLRPVPHTLHELAVTAAVIAKSSALSAWLIATRTVLDGPDTATVLFSPESRVA
jgi:hypothetical protein